ncbi:hypothetical protein UFOVP253_12 [uncultured Caudovirales phage]|uniref:Uncharacterized protein n=1 Tax=uncultured Caudovirales phage TaxID=2100421 RepID=A0A6J5LDX1_9CAUD|nr:hypothetical protein UFOVP253_12 [uncultured Caudovirales phage]
MTRQEAYARIEALDGFLDAMVDVPIGGDYLGTALQYYYQTVKSLEEGAIDESVESLPQ